MTHSHPSCPLGTGCPSCSPHTQWGAYVRRTPGEKHRPRSTSARPKAPGLPDGPCSYLQFPVWYSCSKQSWNVSLSNCCTQWHKGLRLSTPLHSEERSTQADSDLGTFPTQGKSVNENASQITCSYGHLASLLCSLPNRCPHSSPFPRLTLLWLPQRLGHHHTGQPLFLPMKHF